MYEIQSPAPKKSSLSIKKSIFQNFLTNIQIAEKALYQGNQDQMLSLFWKIEMCMAMKNN